MAKTCETSGKMPLSWNDQPEVLTGYRIVFRGKVGERLTEVREGVAGTYYVTQGNLFGSETLACDSDTAVFAALTLIASAKVAAIPNGCRLLKNKKDDLFSGE